MPKKLPCVELCCATDPEWLELRKSGIGASDAAVAAGVSPFKTALELYHEKRDELAPIIDTDYMRMGRRLERPALEEFVLISGYVMREVRYPVPLMRSTELPFMLATPDAVLGNGELVEVKTTRSHVVANLEASGEMGREFTDQIPKHWLLQAQQQLYVTGAAVCWFAVLIDGVSLRTFIVERNEELISAICEANGELWGRIVAGDPPASDWNHPKTYDFIKRKYPAVDPGKAVILSDHASFQWRLAEAAAAQARKLENQAKQLKAEALAEMGESQYGILQGGEEYVCRSRVLAHVAAHTRDYVDARTKKVPRIKSKKRIRQNLDEAARILSLHSFELVATSKTGSRYFVDPAGVRVRVSDHAPNPDKISDVAASFRIDLDLVDPFEAIRDFCCGVSNESKRIGGDA